MDTRIGGHNPDLANAMASADTLDRSLREVQQSDDLSFFPVDSASRAAQAPCNVTVEKYCTALAIYMRQTRGRNLPGIHSTKTIIAIFRQQSVSWERISRGYLHQSYTATRRFLELAAKHVAGQHTAARLMSMFIHPAFDKKNIVLNEKAQELLWPYQKTYPSTYNPAFESASRDGSINRTAHCAEGNHWYLTTKSWTDVAQQSNLSEARVTAAKAIDHAEAYYNASIHYGDCHDCTNALVYVDRTGHSR